MSDQDEWVETIWETIADALGSLGFVLNSREEVEELVSGLPRTITDRTDRQVGASGGDAGAIGTGTSPMRERQDTLTDGGGMEDPSTPPRSTPRHHALMAEQWWCLTHDAGCEGCHCPKPNAADRTIRHEED